LWHGFRLFLKSSIHSGVIVTALSHQTKQQEAGRFLPYGQHSIDEGDIEAVAQALRGASITQGPLVSQFEAALAAELSAPFLSVVSNGTAALQLAYAVLGLEPGDEIITSPITFVATANAARSLGAEVRFADVEPESGNLSISTVEPLINKKTRGVVAVHFGGLPVDLAPLRSLCQRHQLWLVEDAAHAFGAKYQSHLIGDCTFSDATTFSFHPVKHITTGEGGAVAVSQEAQKRWLDRLRQHGVERDAERFERPSPGPWYYEAQMLGYNFRLSEIQCALGLTQVKKASSWLAHRRSLAALYRELIARELSPIVTPQSEYPERESAYHLFPVLIDFEKVNKSRASVMNALRQENIGTQVHYIPVHKQPYYIQRYGEISLPGAEAFYSRELSLPMFQTLQPTDVLRVVHSLAKILTA
jgi:perosamine synthetase